MAAVARIYQASFDKNPRGTLAPTNGALSAVADMLAQSVELFSKRELHPPRYDGTRTIRFAVFGIGMGPLIGRWNRILEHSFPLRSIGGRVSLAALGKRVGADQTVMAPIGLSLFITSIGLMEGKTIPQLSLKYQDMFVPAILANWKVWPAIQLLNFRFMPLAYRVPFQASCGVFWTLYLSLLNSK